MDVSQSTEQRTGPKHISQGRVVAVCISTRKGIRKKDIGKAELVEGFGLRGDAHACNDTHRQVSLLAMENIRECRNQGFNVNPGDFAENITTEGIDLDSLSIGSRLTVGDNVILEITQIGKVCHSPCSIYYQMGKCIMPERGLFARVLSGGTVEIGQPIRLLT